jgi:hypothetical protein
LANGLFERITREKDLLLKLQCDCIFVITYKVLPPYCSSYLYILANDPKEIIFYKGATHGLDEAAEQVHQMVHDWLVKHVKKAGL